MKTLSKLILALSALLMVMATNNSCKEEEIFDQPTLPPSSAFIIDFSDFESKNDAVQTDVSTSQNFVFAATQVLFWRSIIALGLAVPIASYNHALEQNPTMVDPNKWLWSYSITANQDTFTAKLYGTATRDSVFWEMYISKTSGIRQFTDYKWYTGAMANTVSNGYWILNDNPTSNKNLLRIDWERNSTAPTWSIRYTNIVPGGEENGGYIFHGNTASTPFEAFFTIYNKGLNQTTYIEWNRTTKVGRVKASHFYSDSSWHCWDETFQDIECSD
jgi:hypothetical protein